MWTHIKTACQLWYRLSATGAELLSLVKIRFCMLFTSIVRGDCVSTKEDLRRSMLKRRYQLGLSKRVIATSVLERAAPFLLKQILRIYGKTHQRGLVVAGYWPLAGEVDIRPLLSRLSVHGYRIVLPLVTERSEPLTFRDWRPNAIMQTGLHKTSHPLDDALQRIPDVILVPFLAFDRSGFRLGFGGGYYDRTLNYLRNRNNRKRVIAVGVGFSNQLVSHVPRHQFDAALDLVWVL